MTALQSNRVRFRVRGLTSLVLVLTFLAMVCSGVMLYVSPQGKVANWSGWTMAGLEKEQWGSVHTNLSLLFLIASAVHLYLNWRAIWAYLREKTATGARMRWEWVTAAMLVGALTWGTVADITPLSWIGDWNDQIKAHWAHTMPLGPQAHAEEWTIEQLAERSRLSPDHVLAALRTAGFDVKNTQETVAQVGRRNGAAPSQVYAAIRSQFPEAHMTSGSGGSGMGGSGMGWGQMTIADVARRMGTPTQQVIAALAKEGFDVMSDTATLEEVATSRGVPPREVVAILRRQFPEANLGGGGGRGLGHNAGLPQH